MEASLINNFIVSDSLLTFESCVHGSPLCNGALGLLGWAPRYELAYIGGWDKHVDDGFSVAV